MRRIHLLVVGLAVAACQRDAAPGTATITQVSAAGVREMNFSVSPDGRQIAIWRPGDNGADLWVADVDLRHARSLGVTTLFAGTFAPVWSADGRRLAVASSNRSVADVAVVDLATDSVTYLTESPALEAPFQFHPDGDRVVYAAYASGGTVRTFTVSQKTGKVSPLLPGLDEPAIGFVSPDGAHVAYYTVGSRFIVGISDSSGRERREVTREGYEFFPQAALTPWSPDGKEFLYISTRTGKSDIWATSLDGTVRQLTADINDDYSPLWSPDGRSVAFISSRGRQTDLWVMPATGGEPRRVTNDDLDEGSPTWVDDSTLLYTSARSPGSLWRRALNDTLESRILPDSIDIGAFWESPDRRWIAIRIDHGGGSDLAVARPDGSALRILVRNAGFDGVLWNAASTRLAWSSNQGGSMDVYAASLDGDASPVQLESWPGYEYPVFWSAGDSSLVILSTREGRLGDLWRIPLPGRDTTRLSHLGSVIQASSYTANGRQHVMVLRPDPATGEVSLAEWSPGDRLRLIASGNPQMPIESGNGLLAAILPRAGETMLEVFRPDGSVVHSLQAVSARAFSPDGGKLLFNTQSDGQLDLALLDVATGDTTRLTRTPASETAAMFTAGGDSIVFRRVELTSAIMRAELGRPQADR